MKIVSLTFVICMIGNLALASPAQKQQKLKWVLAENAPAILQTVLDNQKIIREKEVEELGKEIERLENLIKDIRSNRIQKKDGKISPKEKAEKIQKLKNDIDLCKQRIIDIKADKVICIPKEPPLLVGKVGTIGSMICTQVIDHQNALVSIHYTVQKMRPINNGRDYIPDVEMNEMPAWFCGDTTNWIDGRIVGKDVGGSYEVTSYLAYCDNTKTYNTSAGSSNTVPELKTFTMDMFIQIPVEND